MIDSTSNPSPKNVVQIVDLGLSGITGAANWALRGTYQYEIGVSYNANGGDLDLIKSLNGNTILGTKTDGTALGNVGIGTTAPATKLEVREADGVAAIDTFRLSRASGGSVAPAAAEMTLVTARGTTASPLALLLGDPSGSIDFQGYDGSAIGDGAEIAGFAEANWAVGSHPTNLRFATIPSASATLTERMRITAAGNVGIGTTSPSAALDVNGQMVRGMFTTSINVSGACNIPPTAVNSWTNVLPSFSYTKNSATSKLLIQISGAMRFNYNGAGWGYFGLLVNGIDNNMCGIYNSDAADHHQTPYCRTLLTGLGAGAWTMQPRLFQATNGWYCFDQNLLVTIEEIY
jgi:hypothetical protein